MEVDKADGYDSPTISSNDSGASSGSEEKHGASSRPQRASGSLCTAGSDGDLQGDDGPRTAYRAWKREEDELLRSLVEARGANRWTDIAADMPGRTGKSCRLSLRL
ncbi:Transcription factor MYB44 [Tetrabaena socialis]|uniref:Transcription factor MYB44 n=1 Tax=Tetrabaena socialis TaxID=47790 RepID=A0A2J7ZGI3_9CHLO|nr:Transcription factor MYB44 [Tetrabaena socialis]|eukprot:PNG99357.1 Transcription factor MYB44 [Tetrabaena socialis]